MNGVRIWFQHEGSKIAIPIHGVDDLKDIAPVELRFEECSSEMDKGFLETTSSLFEDENGVIRMPLNPVDYNENNHVERLCYVCGQSFPQGKMKEMQAFDEEGERVYSDDNHWYRGKKVIFYCLEDWYSDPISDASKWTA